MSSAFIMKGPHEPGFTLAPSMVEGLAGFLGQAARAAGASAAAARTAASRRGMVPPWAARLFRYDAEVKTWGGFPSKPAGDETDVSTQPPRAPPHREAYRVDDAALPFSAILDVIDEA